MKKIILAMIFLLAMLSIAISAETTKTLTFEWNQEDVTNLKEWKLFWSNTPGGEYAEIAIIAYDPGVAGPVYSSPETIKVTGEQGTHVTKCFILRACGDVPQQGGGTKYLCSPDSNEVSYTFWIPAGQFSVPLDFKINAE